MAEVMAESEYNEEDIFDCGICGEIVFLVVVPLIGACRVPVDALSHFMAGADEYTADGMPEHWYGTPSGMWTIKRDRLRILQKSWEAFSVECEHKARTYDALFSPTPEQADSQPQAGNDAPVVEVAASEPRPAATVTHTTKTPRKDSIDPVIELAQTKCRDPKDTNQVWPQMQVLADSEQAPFIASTRKGLKYHKKGGDAYFTRNALDKRLHPEKRKPAADRR